MEDQPDRKGADTLGFFVSPNGDPPSMDDTEAGEPISVSVPGMYETLPEGYDFRAYESQYPSATYGEFTKAHLRRIATGLGVSYNTLAEDLEGVNYSSIRSGENAASMTFCSPAMAAPPLRVNGAAFWTKSPISLAGVSL